MTSARKKTANAAENQHYVPKFILRHFLADEAREQVSVFDKQTGKSFTTSIANIMAERRFNDFQVNDNWRVSFEPAAGKVEEQVLATYQRVVASGRLERTVEERSRFDPEFALRFLKWREEKRRGRPVRGAWAEQPRSFEEVKDSILRKINAIKAHDERAKLAAGWTRDETTERMIPPGWVRVEPGGGEDGTVQ